MKHFSLIILTSLVILSSCNRPPPIEELKRYAATERFPEDAYLDTVMNKRALIIVAHDDDDCIMSGTISKLTRMGWEIEQLALQNTPLARNRLTHPAEIICGGNQLILKDGHYRNIHDSVLSRQLAIPVEEYEGIFEVEKVREALTEKVNAFNPSVIFTLDSEIGGYGHAEHMFINLLVLDLFMSDAIKAERIYQGVYTDHMEREIIEIRLTRLMEKWGYTNTYMVARDVYNVTGMPEPDVQINITEDAGVKMEYLRAYHPDAIKNMRKFIPHYEAFDADTYFGIFDREFFKVHEKPLRSFTN